VARVVPPVCSASLLAVMLVQVPSFSVPEVVRAELIELRAAPETPARLAAESRLLFLAAQASPDERHRQLLHTEGLDTAARALRQNGSEPGAMLWWAAHRGAQASVLDPFAALRIAREVEEILLRLRATRPDYGHAAADRVLGKLYQVAPRGISVGSLEKAREHLLAAIDRDPAFPGNALFYAQYLLETKDCDGARDWATRVLRSPAPGAHALERAGWIRDARRLLARLPARCPREEAWP